MINNTQIEIDPSKIFSHTKEDIQKLISKLKTGDKNANIIAKSLEKIPDDFFEETTTQKNFTKLIKLLRSKGLDDKKLLEVIVRITGLASTKVFHDIKRKMSFDQKYAWQDFLLSNPNELQQIYMLDIIYKALTGKSVDTFYEDVLKKMTNIFLQFIKENEKAIKTPLNVLKKINLLFEEKEYDKALNIIYKNKIFSYHAGE